MKPLRFDDEAQEEFDDAIVHYERERPGLGARFLGEIDAALLRIQEAPATHERAHRRRTDLRRAVVNTFPFTVVFIELPAEIRVPSGNGRPFLYFPVSSPLASGK